MCALCSWFFIFFLHKWEKDGKKGKRLCFGLENLWRRYCWCDLVCGCSMSHWTWKMRRQRWPWLEVCLVDYFMSVFRCVCTCAHRWLQLKVERPKVNIAGYAQSIIFIVWVITVSVGVYYQEKLSWLFSCFAQSCRVCVCIYVIMCEVLTPADVSEWSQTCVRGQDEGSSYINTPREIECERALGLVGPRD